VLLQQLPEDDETGKKKKDKREIIAGVRARK
jgi:hypothetical protein